MNATAAECSRCGIVIAKYLLAQNDSVDVWHLQAPTSPTADDQRAIATRHELFVRALAIPVALIAARVAVASAPAAVRMLTMWVHESGHAIAAWLCGYTAWPGPWFTPVSHERSPFLFLLLIGGLGYGAYQAWLRRRWLWGCASLGCAASAIVCTWAIPAGRASALIVFSGDGGCFVLGALLMSTMYAGEDHPLRRDNLRWGLLAIGALAFTDAYAVWSGPLQQLPFGANENGLSDPSVLTEVYGWSTLTLVGRYIMLARLCLLAVGVAYLAGLYASLIANRPASLAVPNRSVRR